VIEAIEVCNLMMLLEILW